jgi:hypothetical protein
MKRIGLVLTASFVPLIVIAGCSDQPERGPAGSAGTTSGSGGGGGAVGGAGGAAGGGAGGTVSTGGSSGSAGSGTGGSGGTPPGLAPPGPPATAKDFGDRVKIYDPSMPMAAIQGELTSIFGGLESAQFSTNRYALLFKPGAYNLDVRVGYYTQVLGVGRVPDDVAITGQVRVTAEWFGGNATHNFWRIAENVSVIGTDTWAVSQGAALRRVHIKGSLNLSAGGWSSGGFLADSKVDAVTNSGSQQQWFSRNVEFGTWQGGVWNMVFVGSVNAPTAPWPANPFTVVENAPALREKPFLFLDDKGEFSVMVPDLKANARGTSWGAGAQGSALTTGYFYVAHPQTDNAASMNQALSGGRNLLLTPGIYHLEDSIKVTRHESIVLGIGLVTLVPDKGTPAMSIADVDGVKLGGVMFDAGAMSSPTLLEVGEAGSSRDHATNPTSLFDVFCRIGGGSPGTAASCVTINSNHVIGDNFWLWRADHGSGVGWDSNRSNTGLIVNGNNVTIYGLAVEHFQQYQTMWNGNGGQVFFYQSELPYDPPNQAAWQHAGINGYASYKVGDSVTTHDAWGVGVYSAFRQAVVSETAIEAPSQPGVRFHHAQTVFLNGNGGINHILNNTGAAVTTNSRRATLE